MSEIENIEAARAAYARVQPLYERLATEIRHILETKLVEAGLAPVSITHRPKAIESFAAKITRKHYSDPLSQMTDLAGVRVVCAYESELAKVAEIVEASFEVRERIDKARDLGVDRMSAVADSLSARCYSLSTVRSAATIGCGKFIVS